jgi:PKD repeat protein
MNQTIGRQATTRGLRVLLAAAALSGVGCGLQEKDVPPLSGPAELGTAIRMEVFPDVIIANGFSFAEVRATVRDQNGNPLRGEEILFTINDQNGRVADLGEFVDTISTRNVGTSVTVRTGADGVARAVYESPSRTDFTASGSVVISARPVGTDFNTAVGRTVRLELRSAEPRLFPQDPTNTLPTCNFVVQSRDGLRANVSILFQSTSFDADPGGRIVRYEWFFSDGVHEDFNDHPDTNHVFRSPGTYVVTHLVTDNGGLQAACKVTLDIT